MVLAAIAVTSCGPLYRHDLLLTPPKDPSGRQCVVRCTQAQSFCESEEIHRRGDSLGRCYDKAAEFADEAFADYERERTANKKPVEKSLFDFQERERSRCNSLYQTDEKICKRSFLRCFKLCGGELHLKTVCVDRCKNAEPDSIREYNVFP